MNSNNYNNDEYFRNTPQKEEINKGWLNNPVSQPVQYGAPPSPSFSNTTSMPNVSFSSTNPSYGIQRTSPQYTSTPSTYGQQSTLYKPPTLNTFGSSSYYNKPMNGIGSSSGTLGQSTTTGSFYSSGQTGIGMPIMSSSSTSYGSSANPMPKQAWSMTSKGSKVSPYSQTRFSEDAGIFSYIVDITAMPDYVSKCVDEIRQEDYENNLAHNRVLPSANLTTNNSFGAQPPSGIQTNLPASSGLYSSPSMISNSGTIPSTSLYSSSPSLMSHSQNNTVSQSSFIPVKSPLGISPTSSSLSNFTSSSQSLPGITPNPVTTTPSIMQTSFNPSMMQSSFSPKPNDSLIAPSITSSSMFNAPGNSSFSVPITNSSSISAPVTSFNPQQMTASSQQSSFTPGLNPTPQFSNTTSPQLGNSFITSSFRPVSSFSQATVPQSTTTSTFSTSLSNIDFDDPYLVKRMKFEKVEPTMPDIRRVLPKPIFNTKKESTIVNFKIRAPRPIPKSPVYTIPDLKDIDVSQGITNLVIGFENKGRIEYLEPVKVTSIDEIQRKVMFRDEVVEISDPVGTGLNKKAKVYIEGFYPVCRVTNVPIKGKQTAFPQKGIQERFIYQLKTDKNRKFIDYNPDNGLYIYEVSYFE